MHHVIFTKPCVGYIIITLILDKIILILSHLPSVSHLGSGGVRIRIQPPSDSICQFLTYVPS